MNLKREVWEGWTVQDFINELEPIIEYQTFNSKEELKKWCADNQPYYKKHIPEVVKYFADKLNIK